jgi:hypothetical protein
MSHGRSVTVENRHSGQNVGWTYGVVRNVTWSVCGWTSRQGTDWRADWLLTADVASNESGPRAGGNPEGAFIGSRQAGPPPHCLPWSRGRGPI